MKLFESRKSENHKGGRDRDKQRLEERAFIHGATDGYVKQLADFSLSNAKDKIAVAQSEIKVYTLAKKIISSNLNDLMDFADKLGFSYITEPEIYVDPKTGMAYLTCGMGGKSSDHLRRNILNAGFNPETGDSYAEFVKYRKAISTELSKTVKADVFFFYNERFALELGKLETPKGNKTGFSFFQNDFAPKKVH